MGVTRVRNLPPPHLPSQKQSLMQGLMDGDRQLQGCEMGPGLRWVDGLYGISIDTGVLWLAAAECV